jgi:hypothetical protein
MALLCFVQFHVCCADHWLLLRAVLCCAVLRAACAQNTQVTEAIAKVASAYKVNAVQGVLSHQMKHFVIDGEKVILNRADPEQKVEEIKVCVCLSASALCCARVVLCTL